MEVYSELVSIVQDSKQIQRTHWNAMVYAHETTWQLMTEGGWYSICTLMREVGTGGRVSRQEWLDLLDTAGQVRVAGSEIKRELVNNQA